MLANLITVSPPCSLKLCFQISSELLTLPLWPPAFRNWLRFLCDFWRSRVSLVGTDVWQ